MISYSPTPTKWVKTPDMIDMIFSPRTPGRMPAKKMMEMALRMWTPLDDMVALALVLGSLFARFVPFVRFACYMI
jgi:hypothetical protein